MSGEKFRVVDGRKYHHTDTTDYPLPNDEEETERLKLQHRTFKHFLSGNYVAPVTDLLNAGGAKVLDVCCGPGVWTLDLAQEFPQSQFYGIDISPTFLKTSTPNVTFIEGNALDGLPYPDATFDFVFSRFSIISFTTEQRQKKFIPELLRVTKPGGWIEFFETSYGKFAGSPAFLRLISGLINFTTEKGMDPNLGENLPTMLEATGKIDSVASHVCNMPIGPKHGEWAEAILTDLVEFFKGTTPMLASALNMTSEHVRSLIDAFSSEVHTIDTFLYTKQVYARKKLLEAVTC